MYEDKENIWVLRDAPTGRDNERKVLAYWKNRDEFVTWRYNTERKSFFLGRYFIHYKNALNNFEWR